MPPKKGSECACSAKKSQSQYDPCAEQKNKMIPINNQGRAAAGQAAASAIKAGRDIGKSSELLQKIAKRQDISKPIRTSIQTAISDLKVAAKSSARAAIKARRDTKSHDQLAKILITIASGVKPV